MLSPINKIPRAFLLITDAFVQSLENPLISSGFSTVTLNFRRKNAVCIKPKGRTLQELVTSPAVHFLDGIVRFEASQVTPTLRPQLELT